MWLHILWILLFVEIIKGFPSDLTQVIRDTTCGKVAGYVREIHEGRPVESFLGIPYAKPPVKDLRFEDPVPAVCWRHRIRDTFQLPPACPQFANDFGYIRRYRPGFNYSKEDCLYLNVYVPQTKQTKLAVMIYFHGGSNIVGMGSYFDGDTFSAYSDVILVTVNHRIGKLGLLGSGQSEFRGNYALLDQILAMKWVQQNIAFFNGDAERVTITGHSAGGFNVGLHMVSPLAKGLFRGVIHMSGSPMNALSVLREPQQVSEYFVNRAAKRLNCHVKNLTKTKECLKTVDAVFLYAMQERELDEDGYRSSAVVDGHYLPHLPEKLISHGQINAKYVMGGILTDEGFSFVVPNETIERFFNFTVTYRLLSEHEKPIIHLVKHEYTAWQSENTSTMFAKIIGDALFDAPLAMTLDLLKNHSNISLYMYQFDHLRPDGYKVKHGSDLYYLFGSPLCGHARLNFTENDRIMSKMYISMFGSFVKYGNPHVVDPTTNKTTKVPAYSTKSRPFVSFTKTHDGKPTAVTRLNYKPRQIAFWNSLLPELKKQLRRCSNVGSFVLPKNQTYHPSTFVVLFGVFLLCTVILIAAFAFYAVYRRKQTFLVSL